MADINAIKCFANANDLFQFAAEEFTTRSIACVKEKGTCTVVLSGGSTPKFFFSILTGMESYKKRIPWGDIKFFFSDERYLPVESADNNYHMVNEHLFSKVPVLADNIYRMKTEFNDPNEAANDYEKMIRSVLHLNATAFPSFDLVYLGLGEDAHTASLMPFSDVVMRYAENVQAETIQPLVASLWVPHLSMHRITLTPPAINHSARIIFQVTGQSKAQAVKHVLKGQHDPQAYPAQLIHPEHGQTQWYLDKDAAMLLAG